MPNWCYTNISISRPKEKGGVRVLYDLLTEWTGKGSETKNDFGNMWLGTVVERGLKADPINGDYRCRGTICQLDMNTAEDELSIDTETAWGPMLKMWIDLAEKYLPGAELKYVAEESGMEVYETNDPDYKDKYYIDSWGEIEPEWVASEEDVRETVAEVTGQNVAGMDIDKVIELVTYEEHEISIHKWNYEEGLRDVC